MTLPEDLERLVALRQQGALSEREFEAAKQRLLGIDRLGRADDEAPSPETDRPSRPVSTRREPDQAPSGTVRTNSQGSSGINLQDGRVLLGAGSAVLFGSLFMPWVTALFLELNAIDVVRLILDANREIGALSSVLGLEAPDLSGVVGLVVMLTAATALSVTAPLWKSQDIRLRVAVLSNALLLAMTIYGVLAYSVHEFVDSGAVVFALATLYSCAVAIALYMRRRASGTVAQQVSQNSSWDIESQDVPQNWTREIIAALAFIAFAVSANAAPSLIVSEMLGISGWAALVYLANLLWMRRFPNSSATRRPLFVDLIMLFLGLSMLLALANASFEGLDTLLGMFWISLIGGVYIVYRRDRLRRLRAYVIRQLGPED